MRPATPELRFAALSAAFAPSDAVRVIVEDPGESDPLRSAADLREVCELVSGEDRLWLLRPDIRNALLSELQQQGHLNAALEQRQRWPGYNSDARALSALLRHGLQHPDELEKEGLGRALTAVQTGRADTDFAPLHRLWRLLELAQAIISPEPALRARSLLDRASADARAAALLGSGFEGRGDEIARIRAWVRSPTDGGPLAALYVQGLPAVGKSSLLEKVLTEPGLPFTPILVRMDFDRTGLDPRDRVRMTAEFARQVASQQLTTAAMLEKASLMSFGRLADPAPVRRKLPEPLVTGLQAALSGVTLIVVALDTMEALAARGPLQTEQLFEWLDDLHAAFGVPMAIIAGGRGEGRPLLGRRMSDRSLVLDRLSPPEQERMMQKLGVPGTLRAQIAQAAAGNPLRLKLASRAAAEDPEGFSAANAIDAPHLYRLLRSRLPDPRLRDIVEPGLLLRRINRDAFHGVITRFFRLEAPEAMLDALFDALVAQTWLYEPDPRQPGFYRQPAPVRALVLELIPPSPQTRRFHRLAADWLARQPSTLEQADGLFHRLQGGRTPGARTISPELASMFDDQMLEELNGDARRAVLWARGDLSSRYEATSTSATAPAPAEVQNLAISLDRGDLEEADYLYQEGFADRYVSPTSPAGDVQRAYLWRSGRWRAAEILLRERDRIVFGDHDLIQLMELSRDVAFCRVEMRAERNPRELERAVRQDPGLRSILTDLYHGDTRGRLRGGAADFLLRQMDISTSQDRRGDVVGFSMSTWIGQQWASVASDLHVPVPPGADPEDSVEGRAEICRTLARFTPHAEPVLALLGREEAERTLAGLSPELRDRIEDRAPLVYESLATRFDSLVATGWFSEWLSIEAFRRRNADLTQLSRRAEAWRQTIAGRWRFGNAPFAWDRSFQTLDVVTTARIFRLLKEPDPVAAALEELEVWGCSPKERRLQRLVDEAAQASWRVARSEPAASHLQAARRLQRLQAPAALVPALAVLATPWWEPR
ncbi:hypothetical protein ACWKV8_15035 [Brevundimonas diminuta ATCC 11568]